MGKDTILFILAKIEKELETADIAGQLYLIERRNINLKKLENYGKSKSIDANGVVLGLGLLNRFSS